MPTSVTASAATLSAQPISEEVLLEKYAKDDAGLPR